MEQFAKTRFSYHFGRPLRAGGADSLHDIDLPGEACPKLKSEKDVPVGDPMMAPIWRRWIAGIANIEK